MYKFSALNPKAKLFTELLNNPPTWWNLLRNDKDLYIDIRKDNYIKVYYYGGNLAKITYGLRNGLKVTTHQKYLGDIEPRGKNKKGHNIFNNDSIDLHTFDRQKIKEIKYRIEIHYLNKGDIEKPAEKKLQGKLILENKHYIDSEFQFNKDSEIGNIRIDLIKLQDGVLSFLELKGITDERLLHDEKRNNKTPDVIKQIENYSKFIEKYQNEIVNHYKKLIEIKQNLGLLQHDTNFSLDTKPKLLIINTYQNSNVRRENRIQKIKNLLEDNNIEYFIEKSPRID